jgi:hypothetical protein
MLVLALGLAACADPSTAPRTAPGPEPSAARSAKPVPNAPTSPAWHEEARALVAPARLDANAAARVYAALGVAQYQAVVTADGHFDVEGPLPEHGLGEGGRRLLESRRGAVAGASAAVLSYFFPGRGVELEARVRVARPPRGGTRRAPATHARAGRRPATRGDGGGAWRPTLTVP